MLAKEQLKQILIEQKEALLKKPYGIEREQILSIPEYKKIPHVIVITGLRRVGKSTFLRQIISKYYSDSDFYYVSFEDERLFNFKAENFNEIYETLVELYGEQKTFFLDEIQNIPAFENFIRRFYDAGFKFYITGSNANLLSKEIGTKLTGRHVDLLIPPFTFYEYLLFNNVTINNEMFYKTESKAIVKKLFDEYLTNGGMPEFLQFKEPEILRRIYEDIVIKDIAVRYGIVNLFEMRELYQYLITNFGNRFSFTRVKKIVGLGSVNTVKNYLHFLTETYFVSLVNKFEYSLKKQIANEKKLYVIDNGFIQRISTKLNKDKGWLLENLVFNKLNRTDTIFYFSVLNAECDFIVQSGKEIKQVIQVCWELTKENEKRELKGLLEAIKYFKMNSGLILTSDQENEMIIEDKKIIIKPVWKWLLQ
ncbi:MAG: ATP-binding protein [bacterium]